MKCWPGGKPPRWYAAAILKAPRADYDDIYARVPHQIREIVRKHVENTLKLRKYRCKN